VLNEGSRFDHIDAIDWRERLNEDKMKREASA